MPSMPSHADLLRHFKVEMRRRGLRAADFNEDGEPVIELRGAYLHDPDGTQHLLGSYLMVNCEKDTDAPSS